MERLVDKKTAAGPAEARLARLVESSAPLSVTEADKQRCLEGVLERRHTPRAGVVLLRPAVIGAILLAAGVTAATTVGRRWFAQRPAAVTPAPLPAPQPPPQPALAPRPAPALDVPPAEPAPVVRAPMVEAPRHTARPARARPLRAGEDPARVVAAIKALRSEHDPERAAALLAEYLRVYPHGALAEEALALSIEAAAARRSPSAATFAEQYLAQYPTGRFKHTAQQALARPKP